MAKLSKTAKLELLARRAARLVKKTATLRERLVTVERELVSAVASDADPATLTYQLNNLRRRSQEPFRQARTVMARVEAKGGAHLVDQFVAQIKTRKRKKAKAK